MPSIDAVQTLVAIGRLLLGALFVIGGARHFGKMDEIAAMMAAKRIPAARTVLIAVSVFEILAGGLLVLGLAGPWPALSLAAFTVVASGVMLDFWRLQGPERDALFNVFLGNAAITGGLLVAAAASI